jgi:pyruvate-formate lyase-activating enzyme
VTDKCDITCKGCYRNQIEGHRPPDQIKQDILKCKEFVNCDYITIAGGEPLVYPHLLDIVSFIKENRLKSAIFSNGVKLDHSYARELKKAGLNKIHLHIDSQQERPDWMGKNEEELIELRQHYADLLWDIKGIQVGFHVTIYRSNLESIPRIVSWAKNNMQKVQHVSFIAYRSMPVSEGLTFWVNGKQINPEELYHKTTEIEEINITTEEMYQLLVSKYPCLQASGYLNGSSSYESYKYLVIANIGTKNAHYGVMGLKSLELAQVFYHLVKGRYFAFLGSPRIGKKVFILSLFDSKVRKAFNRFLLACLKNPIRLTDRIYTQSIHFQQPNEVINGKLNLCDDCVNMMFYNGKLINSCQLDEYRSFGAPIMIMQN